MKGVVFTEFLDLVEQRFGFEMVDVMIESCHLASGGSYTAVGTYDHQEMVDLLGVLSERSGMPVPDLLKTYGEHLFGRFAVLYPQFFENGLTDAFDFLEGVEDYIHLEVRKLYPNAQMPRFENERPDERTLVMTYHSARHFEDLAEGLIHGCLKHYGQPCEVTRNADPDSGGVRFVLTKN